MFRWLESLLVINDDRSPIMVDAVIGIGIDVSKSGKKPSPYSEAVAHKCLQLCENGTTDNILFTGGYHIESDYTEATTMRDCLGKLSERFQLFLEEKSFRTYLNADYTLPIIR